VRIGRAVASLSRTHGACYQARVRSARPRWSQSPERAELIALYAEVDALLEGCTCACSAAGVTPLEGAGEGAGEGEAHCCYFGMTGREPYPTAVELEEVLHAMRASNVVARDPRQLSLVEERARRPCPLLSPQGRCRIYASRPFGCRTFFCEQRPHRAEVNALGRRIADLSARFAPRDPGPRPLVRALLADRRR
jgi:hypothetical protein